MVKGGFRDVSLKQGLVDRIDAFLATNPSGFTSRAELVSTAVRRFVDEQSGERPHFKEDLYAELLFLLQHTLDTTDPKEDPIQRLLDGLITWRRSRLGIDED